MAARAKSMKTSSPRQLLEMQKYFTEMLFVMPFTITAQIFMIGRMKSLP